MRYTILSFGLALMALQPACAHMHHGEDHGPPFGHTGPMDSNITLGLQEIWPMVHGHPHGPPPPPDAPRPTAFTRTFDFNETVNITQADGQVVNRGVRGNVAMHDNQGVLTLDGNVTLVGDAAGNGDHASLQLTALSGDGPGRCMWPTAGTVTRTNADGSVHHLVFGPACDQATLDGRAVTLPSFPFHGGPHHHGAHDGPHGHDESHDGRCPKG